MSFHVPNQYRVRKGAFGSDDSIGNAGAFFVPNRSSRLGAVPLKIIASDAQGWEHVSVSLPDRCPTWLEMCNVKAMFWDDEDAVMQLHPPRSEWVNNHNFCLHLWRPTEGLIPLPPGWMVGYKNLSPEQVAGLSEEEGLRLIHAAR